MSKKDLTDAEIGELDDLLAAIPDPFEVPDVVALDGFLCGVLCQPVLLMPSQWLPVAMDWNWGEPGAPRLSSDTAGWHSAKHERLEFLVLKRFESLGEVFTEDGWFDPLVMQPLDEDDQPLQGKAAIDAALAPWALGFEHAQNHFSELQDLTRPEVPDLLACVYRHLPAQSEEEQAYTQALDAEHPLKSLDAAIEDLVGNVIELADLARAERVKVSTVRREQPKVGRNAPCPCGSGKKFKVCHGADAT